MREAIAVAQRGLASNDVPVGALIVDPSGKIIATGTNEREAKSDPTAHAEIVAMRKAATNGWRLDNHTIVVTSKSLRRRYDANRCGAVAKTCTCTGQSSFD